jgi:hypothetical protein
MAGTQVKVELGGLSHLQQGAELFNCTQVPTTTGNADVQIAPVPDITNDPDIQKEYLEPGENVVSMKQVFDWVIMRITVPNTDQNEGALERIRLVKFNGVGSPFKLNFRPYVPDHLNKAPFAALGFTDKEGNKWVLMAAADTMLGNNPDITEGRQNYKPTEEWLNTRTKKTVLAWHNDSTFPKRWTQTVEVPDPHEHEYYVTVNMGSGSGWYEPGETVTIEFEKPNDDYEFLKWLTDVNVQWTWGTNPTQPKCTFIMPKSNVVCTPQYDYNESFLVIVRNGTASHVRARPGDIITITADDKSAILLAFRMWVHDHDDIVFTDGSLTISPSSFIMPAHDVYLEAEFLDALNPVIEILDATDRGYVNDIDENIELAWLSNDIAFVRIYEMINGAPTLLYEGNQVNNPQFFWPNDIIPSTRIFRAEGWVLESDALAGNAYNVWSETTINSLESLTLYGQFTPQVLGVPQGPGVRSISLTGSGPYTINVEQVADILGWDGKPNYNVNLVWNVTVPGGLPDRVYINGQLAPSYNSQLIFNITSQDQVMTLQAWSGTNVGHLSFVIHSNVSLYRITEKGFVSDGENLFDALTQQANYPTILAWALSYPRLGLSVGPTLQETENMFVGESDDGLTPNRPVILAWNMSRPRLGLSDGPSLTETKNMFVGESDDGLTPNRPVILNWWMSEPRVGLTEYPGYLTSKNYFQPPIHGYPQILAWRIL